MNRPYKDVYIEGDVIDSEGHSVTNATFTNGKYYEIGVKMTKQP